MPGTLFSRTTYQYCKYSHASKVLVDQYLRLKALGDALENCLWFLLQEEILSLMTQSKIMTFLNYSKHLNGMVADDRCIWEKILY